MDQTVHPLSERQRDILSLVHTDGYCGIETLSKRFQVSAQTIRRDVNTLCEVGQLRRVHGGVEPPSRGNLGYTSRQVLNLGAKLKIARAFSALVRNGQSLAVSIGTTPEIAVRELTGLSDITLLTNNLHTATNVCDREGWSVIVPSGQVRPGDHDILGPETEAFFDRFQVDFGVFGVAGVAEDGTLLDFTASEVASRLAIQRNCRCSVLLLDQTKFSRPAHVRGGHIADVDKVICDGWPPRPVRDALTGARRDLIVVEDGQ